MVLVLWADGGLSGFFCCSVGVWRGASGIPVHVRRGKGGFGGLFSAGSI